MGSTGVVYRRNFHRVAFSAVYAVGAVGTAVLAVVVQPAIAVGAILLVLLAWRTFRIGVVAGEDVTVRNVLRDRHVAWDIVDRFGWGMWGSSRIGGVYLRDGRFLRAFALNPPFEMGTSENPAVPRALDGLNAELARRRGPGTA
jgi:hypothetical protein